jgi:hypothetical protein
VVPYDSTLEYTQQLSRAARWLAANLPSRAGESITPRHEVVDTDE